MYARITRAQTPPDRIEDLARVFTETALPAIRKLPGYAGCSMAVDRESGDGQTVTFYESQEALAATREQATAIRTESTGAGGATVTSVQEYEIALMERFTQPSTPSFLRVIRAQGDPAKLDALVQAAREQALPALREVQGFRALVVAVDRETGRAVVTGVYESSEARQAADARLADIRRGGFEAAGAEQPEVSLYEVLAVEFVGAGAATG